VGRKARTPVPPSGRAVTTQAPPSSAARSRIERSPTPAGGAVAIPTLSSVTSTTRAVPSRAKRAVQQRAWVNGTARVVEAEDGNGERPRVERWVEVRVQEAYIHCRKQLSHLVKADGEARAWGTDDTRAKGGDYFGASCEARPWVVDS